MGDASALVLAGGCAAWTLPEGGTAAGGARSVVREICSALGMSGDLAHDLAVSVSEIVSNVHVHASRGEAGVAEMWAYMRWGPRPEVVVKVFDAAAWRGPIRYGATRVAADAESGRGFEVVDALTAEHRGGWGMHRTRSRLGMPPVTGKAVFVSVPVPLGPRPVVKPVRQVAWEVYALLAARGIGRLQCSVGHGMAVICARAGVHVWVREESISYCVPGRGTVCRGIGDGVEVVEQVVRHCVDLDVAGAVPVIGVWSGDGGVL